MISFLLVYSVSKSVMAYPQDQFNDCILAAKSNPAVIDLPTKSLEAFCDCALKAIVDEGKNEKKSANQCAMTNLNK